MAFHETQFPTEISVGSQVIPRVRCSVIFLGNGEDRRIAFWRQPHFEFNAKYGIASVESLYDVQQFFMAREGSVHGFRFQNPLDYTSAADGVSSSTYYDQVIGWGNGSTTQFQLSKQYDDGVTKFNFGIFKPVSGSVTIGLDGIQQDPATGPTITWSVDTTTGVITTSPAVPYGSLLSSGYSYDLPCMFGEEIDRQMLINLKNYNRAELPNIPIYELPQSTVVYDEFDMGMAKEHGDISNSIYISTSQARVHSLKVTTTGLRIWIDNAEDMAVGGLPALIIFNNSDGVTHDIDIYSLDKTQVGTLQRRLAPDDAAAYLSVGYDSTGAKKWEIQSCH
jgi:uncharacterized protein (TIGR02217 family)